MTSTPERSIAPLHPAGVLWIASPLWYLLCEAVAAANFPGYDYATFYISDLGVSEHGAMDGRVLASTVPQVMNAGFIGAGLLFFLGLVLLVPTMARASRVRTALVLVLGAAHTVGVALVGLVPGSPSAVENGLMDLHVLGAVLAIVGGNLTAILSAAPLRSLPGARWLGPVLGALGLLCAVLLTLQWQLPDGVWERGAVYAFYLWQLLLGVIVLRHPRPR